MSGECNLRRVVAYHACCARCGRPIAIETDSRQGAVAALKRWGWLDVNGNGRRWECDDHRDDSDKPEEQS